MTTVPIDEASATEATEAPLAGTGPTVRARLRILQTTDLHSQIMPYDYFADRPAPETGLALVATLIARMRAETPGALLFDNGDFLQGNPLSDWAADLDARGESAPHPVITVMNALRYDALGLGNHEFNYGLRHLMNVLRSADFPAVCANVVTDLGAAPLADTPLVPPWAVLERQVMDRDGAAHAIRIGVIGLAPPQITDWERFSVGARLRTRDIVEAARAHTGALRAAGADLVVALCHSGIGADAHTPGMENAAVPLAAVEGIDVVLAGHTHHVFPGTDHAATAAVDPRAGTLHGKPAVMAGSHGSHLGVIDLDLARTGGGVWRVAGQRVKVLPVAARASPTAPAEPLVAPDPLVTETVRPAHVAVLRGIRAPIARTTTALSTHFACAAPSAALALVADLVRGYIRETVPARTLAGVPLIAAVAPFMAGGQAGARHFVSIPVGPLAVRHASELYPFPNGICLLRLTGADVLHWLEVSAMAFARIAPDCRDQPLRNEAVPSYNFDVMHGLRYTIDAGAAAGARIRQARLPDGRPVARGDTFLVVTNSYRAGGGGGFAAATLGELVYSERRPLRDVLIEGLRRAGTVSPVPRPIWDFAPIRGASAWIDAGEDAALYPASLPGGTVPEHLGRVGEGFERYRIDFDTEGPA